jgi:hypothetical protein
LGYSTGRKITIWFCKNQEEFDIALGAPIQDWAAGAAYPMRARIVIRDPAFGADKRINLEHLVKHEITHVIFGLYMDDYLQYIPRWFNEGLAMYEADQWTYGHYWTMLTAALSNSLFHLYQLEYEFPHNTSQAHIAYAQSYSVVKFIVSEYGDDSLKECIKLMAEGRGFDEALAGAIGIDSYWLERRWLKAVKNRYKWLSVVTSWFALWGFIVFIALTAYWRRKAKNRRIIKQWESEEELWWQYDYDDSEEAESEEGTYTWQ